MSASDRMAELAELGLPDDATDDEIRAARELDAQPDPPSEEPRSAWDLLREERDRVADEVEADDGIEPLELDVPGYYGFVVRYKWVDTAAFERLAKRAAKMQMGAGAAQYVAAHSLALACDEVLVRSDEDHDPEPHPGGAVTFNTTLAQALRLDLSRSPDKVHAVVREVFSGVTSSGRKGPPNTHQIAAHAERLNAWLIDPTRTVNDRFMGG